MKTSDFDYYLPKELIAQHPLERRDSSRLAVFHKESGEIEHRHFSDITEYLRPGDVLVINDTRVIPARLLGVRITSSVPEERAAEHEKNCEVLLLKRLSLTDWECIVRPGKKLRTGAKIYFSPRLSATVTGIRDEGVRVLTFVTDGVFEEVLDEVGNMPLPPYITEKLEDKSRYNTVYAHTDGSAAAPTAGLHFTPELLQKVKDMGVKIAPVLLHVGLGTFRPVKEEEATAHKMHSEYYEISAESAAIINDARKSGGRVVCVGTTSVRTLESASAEDGTLSACSGNTEIFIYPGYRFKCVDALITNFHLPKSTLIMLVSAFIGRENTLKLYNEAVRLGYRFFSFGDACLLLSAE
ncbi:MAG TPA: tRNA preQ1(34) S-adenosylmethionine ribosyltransferase-isomerase QueA [Firmicutes bacterium]|nr:tRNA preQ1(34) S-adenosylmethionine ribosyltransferase-isomerase QueA [Bacillota bacterium]